MGFKKLGRIIIDDCKKAYNLDRPIIFKYFGVICIFCLDILIIPFIIIFKAIEKILKSGMKGKSK